MAEQRLTGKTTLRGSSAIVVTHQGSLLQIDWTVRSRAESSDQVASEPYPGWPLLIIAVVAIPLGLAIFKRGERYAKKHGKLKRSG